MSANRSHFLVPDEPSGVCFSHVSENEVRLKWMMPNEPNGRVRHYEVSYWKVSTLSYAGELLVTENGSLAELSATLISNKTLKSCAFCSIIALSALFAVDTNTPVYDIIAAS